MRIGLMGGTFDPPHLGHMIPVEIASAEFDLDVVWFVPSFIPPHKQRDDLTDAFHRAAMLALALRRYPMFQLSTEELRQGKRVYTVDTVESWNQRTGLDDRVYFIMGSDSFMELHLWHEFQRLLRICELIIINRGNTEEELKANLEQLQEILQHDLKPRIHFSRASHLPYSATEIRKSIANGNDISSMLFPEVEEYIWKHQLFHKKTRF